MLSGTLTAVRDRLVDQNARYLVASITALACDLLVYTMLVRLDAIPGAAGAIGYSCGLAIHYALSATWVFPDPTRQRRTAPTFAKFAATGLSGLLLTGGTIAALTGAGLCGPYQAKAIAVVVSYAVVFVLRRAYVFALPAAGANAR
jgi:putative flippase GtrA